jgi:hypothetical protein
VIFSAIYYSPLWFGISFETPGICPTAQMLSKFLDWIVPRQYKPLLLRGSFY